MRPPERLGPYVYRLGEDSFPLGQDTLLLGEFATVRRGWRVCDLGCGAGALPLLLLRREGSLAVTGVELDGAEAGLARANLADNGLAGEILTGDLREVCPTLGAGRFDLVVSNPPYFRRGSGRSGGEKRMEEKCTLEELCAAAARLLKNGGRFALTCRPERLAEVFRALGAAGIEPKRLAQVQHNPDTPPSVMLVEGVRQGRPGLTVLPPIFTNGGK